MFVGRMILLVSRLFLMCLSSSTGFLSGRIDGCFLTTISGVRGFFVFRVL